MVYFFFAQSLFRNSTFPFILPIDICQYGVEKPKKGPVEFKMLYNNVVKIGIDEFSNIRWIKAH